jgi:hypothetical protein
MRTTLLILSLLLVACSEPPTEEMRLRALIEQAELAAEARDTGALMDLVAEHYTGERGEGRDAVARAIRGYFILNQQVHVLTRIRAIELLPDGGAHIDLVVAMARTPLSDVARLSESRADLFRIQLELSQSDGEWLVFSASHRRAGPGDFL